MTFSKNWTQSFKGTDSKPFRAHAIASRKGYFTQRAAKAYDARDKEL